MLVLVLGNLSLNNAFGQEAGQQVSGPYTITRIADGVYNIQDANSQNPPGVHTGKEGKVSGMNNCSDIYLILGTIKPYS